MSDALQGALHTALGGLRDASNRAAKAAERIVRAGAGELPGFADLPNSAELSDPLPPSLPEDVQAPRLPRATSGGLTGANYVPSLAEEIVQLRLAAQAYKANATLIRTADEMLETTLESLGESKD